MPVLASARYPYERVLLPRTKLAYVHLHNLLTDAQRDRGARIFGYVAIWLPEEFIILYLQEGELVNATLNNGREKFAIPIAEALSRIPPSPEYGEICFHEADDEQLACMYQSHVGRPSSWPQELKAHNPAALFPYLAATTFDGVVEIIVDGKVNYLIFRDGSVQRAFLTGSQEGEVIERVKRLFSDDIKTGYRVVQRYDVPPPLPVQAAPALVQAYRELASNLCNELKAKGKDSAPAIAEHARQQLMTKHPALNAFSFNGRPVRDPVADSATLTDSVAALVAEVVWAAADHEVVKPEDLLRTLTRDRRHMFQSAGFYERLPWKIVW
jgi:hypothetical protein